MVINGGWQTQWMLKRKHNFIAERCPPVKAEDIIEFMQEFTETGTVPIIAGFDLKDDLVAQVLQAADSSREDQTQ